MHSSLVLSFIGDFGYARTIHEHSLRYSKVGTTAYLPPEVSHDQWRHSRGYNKTVEFVDNRSIESIGKHRSSA